MKIDASYISYSQTKSFSNLVEDYLDEAESLKKQIHTFPSKEAVLHQIERKKTQVIDRELLCHVLNKQSANCDLSEEVKSNIALLKDENTFTICTAHQPNIFTGYLYFMYKIIHAIKLAIECKQLYTAYNFVPVYYMGSEDNDIDEIGTFHYNQKTYSWKTAQQGACGRMTTADLLEMANEIIATLNESNADEKYLIGLLRQAYNGKNTLAEATRIIVNALFGKYGLLVIDGDDIELKKAFMPVMKHELLFQDSQQIVNETITELSSHYKVQASPRAINLFYLKENLRERIEKVGETWQVINTAIAFSEEELLHELEQHPDYFSPNVILRPLYQETILPNIAFVGGGGELAYWLELKTLFEKHSIVYPVLFLRNSVLWLNKKTTNAIEKLRLSDDDIFLNKEKLFTQIVMKNEAMLALEKINNAIQINYTAIIELSNSVSSTLNKSMLAHAAKAKRIEDRIRQKFRAHIKRNDDELMSKIEKMKEQVSPNGTLQERYDNFLSIYKLYGMNMFDILMKYQEGFGKEFLILKEIERI